MRARSSTSVYIGSISSLELFQLTRALSRRSRRVRRRRGADLAQPVHGGARLQRDLGRWQPGRQVLRWYILRLQEGSRQGARPHVCVTE